MLGTEHQIKTSWICVIPSRRWTQTTGMSSWFNKTLTTDIKKLSSGDLPQHCLAEQRRRFEHCWLHSPSPELNLWASRLGHDRLTRCNSVKLASWSSLEWSVNQSSSPKSVSSSLINPQGQSRCYRGDGVGVFCREYQSPPQRIGTTGMSNMFAIDPSPRPLQYLERWQQMK
jgi:hypothetical protein